MFNLNGNDRALIFDNGSDGGDVFVCAKQRQYIMIRFIDLLALFSSRQDNLSARENQKYNFRFLHAEN